MFVVRVRSVWLLSCVALLVNSLAGAETSEVDSQFDKKFKPVFEDLLKDKETAKWVDKVLYDLIRHGLDRKTANAIAKSEFVRKNRPLINESMRQMGNSGRNMLRARGAEASYADNKEGIAGQYANLRETAEQLAEFFNFPQHMRSNLNVFVLDSPVVNAFAYGSLNTIEIAFFTGLIEKLNDADAPITEVNEMVKGTIAHELAHIKNRHVEQRLIVISIFLAKYKNIIPTSLRENFTALMRDQAMQSLYNVDPQQALASEQADLYREMFDYSWEIVEQLASDLSHRATSEPEKFDALVETLSQTFSNYDGMSFIADFQEKGDVATAEEGQEAAQATRKLSEAEVDAGQKLLARYNINMPLDQVLSADMAENLGEAEVAGNEAEVASNEAEVASNEAEVASNETEVASNEVTKARLTFGDFIAFLMALSKLSRSQEITSDRFEQIATSEQSVQNSFARMGGGRNANPEAMMRQAEKWARDLSKDKDLQRAINDFSTHPVNLMRIHQAKIFSQSLPVKVHHRPIYKALALYIEGIKILEQSEQVLEGGSGSSSALNGNRESVADTKEAYELYLEIEKATPFKEMVQNFGEVIADSIIPAEAQSADDLNTRRFADLIEYLQRVVQDHGENAVPEERLAVPGSEEKIEGLLHTINDRLRNIEPPEGSDEPVEKIEEALKLLKPFQPSGSSWEYDEKTSRWVQIESSTADTERRRLEDFRRRQGIAETKQLTKKKAAEAAKRKR